MVNYQPHRGGDNIYPDRKIRFYDGLRNNQQETIAKCKAHIAYRYDLRLAICDLLRILRDYTRDSCEKQDDDIVQSAIRVSTMRYQNLISEI